MNKILQRYKPYFFSHLKYFIYSFIGLGMFSAATASTAYIIKPILDEIFIKQDQVMLYKLPLFIIAIYLLKSVGGFIGNYYTAYIGQDIIREIRDKMVNNIINLDLDFFNKTKKGELISRITNDTNRIQLMVSEAIPLMIRESLTAIGLIGIVIYQNPKLAFFALVVLPLCIYPLSILAKRMKKLSRSSQEKVASYTSSLNEIFQNIELIKTSNTEDLEKNKFTKDNYQNFQYLMKMSKTNLFVTPIMELLGSIGVAGVIIVGGMEVIEGKMSVGTFFSFTSALFMIYTPIKIISQQINKLQDSVAASERIFEYMDLKQEIVSGTNILPQSIDEISFDNITLDYENVKALKEVSLSVKKNQTVALVGDSGGGKSSLVNLIVRFYDPTSGKVLINNQDLKNYDLKDLREKVAYVTQRVFIFRDSVAQNVAYGHHYDRDSVIEALKEANAYEFVELLENGIDTILEEGGNNLSGGQRQRIAIARAIYKNPQILILDEATSALDNKSEMLIKEALKKVSKNKITFIIAHRLTTIDDADYIVVFKKGEIIAQGTKDYIVNNSPEYLKLKNLT